MQLGLRAPSASRAPHSAVAACLRRAPSLADRLRSAFPAPVFPAFGLAASDLAASDLSSLAPGWWFPAGALAAAFRRADALAFRFASVAGSSFPAGAVGAAA